MCHFLVDYRLIFLDSKIRNKTKIMILIVLKLNVWMVFIHKPTFTLLNCHSHYSQVRSESESHSCLSTADRMTQTTESAAGPTLILSQLRHLRHCDTHFS